MTDKKNLGKWLNQIGNFAETAKQAIKQGNNEVALNLMKNGFNEIEYIIDFFYVILLLFLRLQFYIKILRFSNIF